MLRKADRLALEPFPVRTSDNSEDIMPIGVDYTAWMVRDGELRRRLIYRDSESNRYIATIYLDCKLEKGAVEPFTFLSFMFTPFRVVDGLDLGLSLATLDSSRPAPVGVNVTSVDDSEGALMSPRTPQGLNVLLSHLLCGKQLKFGIFQGAEQLVDMPFYNDPEFAQLHRAQVAALSMKNTKIPDGMIQLRTLPVDEDGAPTWTDEIDSASRKFGREFLTPLMYETSPGQCIGGFVARAVFDTPLRTYEARATLLQRANDEYRATVIVTAPSVSKARNGGRACEPHRSKYVASLPKDNVHDLLNKIRDLCKNAYRKDE